MTNRRRRWLRRFAIGVSIAAFAARRRPSRPAGGAAVSRCISRQFSGRTTSPIGSRRAQLLLASAAVRPTTRADRFAISDGASSATSASDAGVSWDGVVTVGLGTLVLVLALGLGLGYVRRPKVARI